METNQILTIARKQLETLIELTDDKAATLRLKLALAALDDSVVVAPASSWGYDGSAGSATMDQLPVEAAGAAQGGDNVSVETATVGDVSIESVAVDGIPVSLTVNGVRADDDDSSGDEDTDDAGEDEPIIPDGFATAQDYVNFLLTQADAIAGDETRTVDDYMDGVMGVVGIDESGNELGDADALVAAANEMVAAQDAAEAEDAEDNGEDAPERALAEQFRVTYRRESGEPLTVEHVETILASQASERLNLLGTIVSRRIEDGDSDDQKVAVFEFAADGLNLEAVARGFVAYRGTSPFPGIGRVYAAGQAA
jgi:hypothetical protein